MPDHCNILLTLTDQHRYDIVGAMGHVVNSATGAHLPSSAEAKLAKAGAGERLRCTLRALCTPKLQAAEAQIMVRR